MRFSMVNAAAILGMLSSASASPVDARSTTVTKTVSPSDYGYINFVDLKSDKGYVTFTLSSTAGKVLGSWSGSTLNCAGTVTDASEHECYNDQTKYSIDWSKKTISVNASTVSNYVFSYRAGTTTLPFDTSACATGTCEYTGTIAVPITKLTTYSYYS
ncbi:hypothetical protein CORC01_06862 [Colletotrichum orchidophilum]|uniref:AA1-like domain-containing protein n=1 Tax=Colletotrichum orchidophilum TaxID=1209926 RepID=A0A1G4B8T2_9PEZI|nr:uncharacterized protein CORC01_06862 [Colletotrichum orchidophilum]OHE97827.1 hypothetical protein CORC01_06862 [Colletotrichum orchidophilum]